MADIKRWRYLTAAAIGGAIGLACGLLLVFAPNVIGAHPVRRTTAFDISLRDTVIKAFWDIVNNNPADPYGDSLAVPILTTLVGGYAGIVLTFIRNRFFGFH